MSDHATLIAELARLRESAREAEKALDSALHQICNHESGHCVPFIEVRNQIDAALTRLRESLKGAGDE